MRMISNSMTAIIWVMQARGLSPVAWKMLMMLANRVNNDREDFEVWPSHRVLAEDCEISVSSVKRHLKDLVEGGFLEARPDFDPGGNQTSNRYILNVNMTMQVVKNRVEVRGGEVVQSDLPPQANLNPPPGQSDLPPSSLVTPQRNHPKEPIQNNQTPPLPSEGIPQSGGKDLFGGNALVPAGPDPIDWLKQNWSGLKSRHPGIAGIRVVDEGLAHTIRTRLKQHAVVPETDIDVLDKVFEEIDSSRFLQGRVRPRQGSENPFKLTVSWLFKASNFREVINGKYTSRSSDRHAVDHRTGEQLGPGDQVARRAVEGILTDRARRRSGSGNDQGGSY